MIKDIKNSLEFKYINQLFHQVRIVDPIKKIVIAENGEKTTENKKCFHLCNKDTICENCISIRAYNENTSVMKFEYIDNKIYMIMATPLNKVESGYVIEAIRDISDCKIVDVVEDKRVYALKKKLDEINKLIVIDELTKCYNRRYINEKLPIDIELAKANNLPLAIAMIDIDYFKLINDKYGHLLGDLVLKDIINIVKDNIRGKSDWIARYGGEEFLILFNDTSKEEAYNLLKGIKSIVENSILKYDDIEINITISIGMASLTNEINDMDKLIRIADKNLYKAKTSGRNCIFK
ncbi:MAG: GGDEF domain-containing protein [Clostridium sp.]|uniref:GGDEF domain-containing protein n=1 Tax=Clostridium sp. TaxID=1506 RepID=UPI0025C379F3|nr:GGDEF domain-containing protein [Clostridium sp.]MBS4956055.1 GGDEF domain-containing protein [Clostridium sp.]